MQINADTVCLVRTQFQHPIGCRVQPIARLMAKVMTLPDLLESVELKLRCLLGPQSLDLINRHFRYGVAPRPGGAIGLRPQIGERLGHGAGRIALRIRSAACSGRRRQVTFDDTRVVPAL